MPSMVACENGLRGTEKTAMIFLLSKKTMKRGKERFPDPVPMVIWALSTFITSGLS